MAVTASRLGSSPLLLDWSGLARHFSPSFGDKSDAPEAWQKLKRRFESGEVGFYDAPITPALSQVKESEALAARLVGMGQFNDVLFLGIGGSALGPICMIDALCARAKNRLRFHFMENPDPINWKLTISKLNPENTLVVVVAKSGSTFETIAQFLIALEWLGEQRWKSHVVAITDPEKGDLRAFARAHGLQTLAIAPSMGGRFSIFTPVGLFPAALAGLSVQDFLLGATQVREAIEKQPIEKNPLMILAELLMEHAEKRPVHVCMPYSTQLKLLGSWFVQLWGESLGKDGKGFTPIAAVGATDQHSILQLLRDGPDDKITFFMTVDSVDDPVAIPRVLRGSDAARYAAFGILQEHSLQELLLIEYRAISTVLSNRGRPHLTFRLDRLDERNFGAVCFAFATLTAMTGTLMSVNPFDQPGVEEGKVYIRDALRAEQRVEAEHDDNSPVARLRRDRE